MKYNETFTYNKIYSIFGDDDDEEIELDLDDIEDDE
jgi:hypothetical protein